MSKILGLDLGTNSIGWAIVGNNRNSEKEIFDLQDKGVLIFQEGVKNEKGNEFSKAAERTGYRGARKLKFRRKLRKYQTLKVLAKYKMCPLSIEEVDIWRNSNFKKYPSKDEFLEWLKTDNQGKKNNLDDKTLRMKQVKNPYYFRDKFSRKKYDWENNQAVCYELGRSFYHLAQRRGFLSNRLDQSDKGIIELHQPAIELFINDSENTLVLTQNIENYFSDLDILNKKSKELNEGEKKLKTLYNSLKKTLKNKDSSLDSTKKELLERLCKKENLGKVKVGISDLDEKIKYSNSRTLGQYFYSIYNKNGERIRNNYTARKDHYLFEFEIICKTQGLEKIGEQEKEPNKRYSGIVKELYKAIFYQRPLKSQKGSIGKCSFEKDKSRCPVSRPEFEEFRMYSLINNIKIKTPDDEKLRSLTDEEKNKIIPKFQRKSKPSFDFEDIVKELIPKDETAFYFKDREAKDAQYIINYKLNTSISGCPTIAAFKNIFGDNWQKLNFKTKHINKKGNAVNYNYQDIWHVWATYSTDQKLKDFAKDKLVFDKDEIAEKFSKINLEKDYASLSLNAINKILPYLKRGLIYSHAVFMANMENVVDKKVWSDEKKRKLICNEIKNIIDAHQTENKALYCVNSLLKSYKDNNNKYAGDAKKTYNDNLLKYLKNEFGTKTWNAKTDKEEILNDSLNTFIKHLKAGTFPKIKRIDEKVIDFLQDNNLVSDESKIEKLYHPSDIEKFKPVILKDKEGNDVERNGEKLLVLGSPISNSIKNPMAMRTLHQLRKLINTLIIEEKIGEHTKIHIELARELNDSNKRKAIHNWQEDRRKLREIYADKIQDLYRKSTGKNIEPTNEDIDKFQLALEQREDGKIVNEEDVLKYQLWEEQNHICLYTNKTIGIEDFLGPNPKFDFEHTIPKSLSLDNSMMNKTLCQNKFNRDIKKNRIPFELGEQTLNEILARIAHWKRKYLALEKEIERLKKASRNATDKEQKDRIIQKRHYLTFERNYWKGKHERFLMQEVPSGFKNSQIVDTGLITRYAQQYLKSYFNKVYTVKGDAVAEFRKQWGIQEEYSKKDRLNHIHHCIDAITIACMTKTKYDLLAELYHVDEENRNNGKKEVLKKLKPWGSFTQDLKNIENEILIVHHRKNKLPIQSKKKLRKRGIIQYVIEFEKDENGNYKRDNNNKKIPLTDKNGKPIYKTDSHGKRIPRYAQGDTVRGPLHLDTFYGAIEKDINGNTNKDKNGNIIPSFLIRKEIEKLSEGDIKNIVDPKIHKIFEKAIKDKIITFRKVNNKKIVRLKEGESIWKNKDKKIPIKKVRVYTPTVKLPLKDFKKHSALFLSDKDYKQQFHVMNDENYCMAIYEKIDSEGNVNRGSELVNNLDAGEYFRLSNKAYRDQFPLVDEEKNGLSLKYILTKGTMVLLYNNSPEEIWDLSHNEKIQRLYEITQLDTEGQSIKLLYHQEAREKKEITKHMGLKIGMKGGKYIGRYKEFPWIKVSPNQFDALVERVDFIIIPTGKIQRI